MRLIVLLVAALALSACHIGSFGAPCGQTRGISAQAAIADGGTALGAMQIGFGESSDTTRPADLSVSATGPTSTDAGPLKGHLVRWRAVSTAGVPFGVDTITPLPPGAIAGPSYLFSDVISIRDRALAAEVRRAFLAGELRIELTTDESPQRTLLLTPQVIQSTDWQTIICL